MTGGEKRYAERCIGRQEADFPRALRAIRGAPARLYVRGRLPGEMGPFVAIVGARRCSSYGREMARWFGEELAACGVKIISGMAVGVDGIAQQAALLAGGESYGVLGCGTDVCYPKSNRALYEALLEKGGVLSEYPPGTPPAAYHFPARNRLISALSDLVLVIEAQERSGALITADFALEQGKDVYALPGRLTDGLSAGCNRLLCQGAGLALSPQDILDALSFLHAARSSSFSPGEARDSLNPPCGTLALPGRSGNFASAPSATAPSPHIVHPAPYPSFSTRAPASEYEAHRLLVLTHMGERPLTLQELFEKIKNDKASPDIQLQEIMDLLLDLVMQGMISQEPGNKYCRRT